MGATLDKFISKVAEFFFSKKSPPPKKVKYESNGEKRCRAYLEKRFKCKFVSTRKISWLKNPKTGRRLEIDCYNARKKLGVEYNGIQHYEYPNTFHRTKKDFDNQLYRDRVKATLCEKHGVTLISVPYHVKNIENFLDRELRKRKL